MLKEAGVVDAGGAGFLLLLDSALHVVAGDAAAGAGARRLATTDPVGAAFVGGRPSRSAVDGELDVSEQRYEVMYFLDLLDDRIDEFKHGWGASATRSWSSAATACGTVTSTPTTSAPRSRWRSTSTVGRSRSG